jgi:multiple sugar transport system permease protein
MKSAAVLVEERAARRVTGATRLRRVTPYLLLLPPILLLLGMVVYPMVYNVTLSLRSYRTGEFVGVHNFLRVFDDALFLGSIKATGIYIILAVGIEVLLGLGLALFIHRTVTSGLLRSLFYVLMILPMVTPPVAAGVVARLMYTPNYGVINYFLRAIGAITRDIEWLSTGPTAMFSVLSVDIWQWTPFVFLVAFAGLQAVPQDTAEAAKVDGASSWNLFRYIEFPYLRSLLLLVLVFRVTDTFRVFDHVLVLTGGGPGSATEFLSVYLYRVAFKFFDLSYAAAISFYVLLAASVVFAFLHRLLVTEAVM